MSVSVNISTASLGPPVSLPVEQTGTPGDTLGPLSYYISHSGLDKIEGCGFYLLPYATGVYLGTKTPQDDLDEILEWGDENNAGTSPDGGLFIDMNAVGGFPGGDEILFRTGVGDSIVNAIPLSADAIITGAAFEGEIAASGEAQISLYIEIPTGEGNAGTRYVTLAMTYLATS